MTAAAYLRRSSATGDNPGDASREAQEAAVRRLCGPDVTLYVDWGVSGRKDDRPDYVRLKEDIAGGRVSSVCAYSLSRLGRNARELLAFIELAGKHGVPVRTAVESIDTSTAMGRAMLTVMAAFAQLEVEQGMERSAAAREARSARHDAAGVSMPPSHAIYGRRHVTSDGITRVVDDPAKPIAPLLDAYREAGSVLGACRLLEDRGIPAPMGGKRWSTSALTRILDRSAPGLLPARTVVGRRSPASARLAHLLRCPFCGRMLTPNTHRGQYYCANGPRDRASHPRYTVREVDVMPWVTAEAERLTTRDMVELAAGQDAKRAELDARRPRVQDMYETGDIDRDEYRRRLAKIDDALAKLETERRVATVPKVDWTWSPDNINRILRLMWDYVELGTDLRPVRAEWLDSTLRRA